MSFNKLLPLFTSDLKYGIIQRARQCCVQRRERRACCYDRSVTGFYSNVPVQVWRESFIWHLLFLIAIMSLEQRNKKVTDVFEKYNIAEWGNGPKRTVSNYTL